MSQNRLRIRTPSRLHFGLLSFGDPQRRQFGGAGVMVQLPGLELWASAAPSFRVSGMYSDRVQRAAESWSSFYQRELPPCELSIASAPRQHIGLGVGTQLALAVAAALQGWTQQPLPSAAELASSVNRAARSAIGVYGFLEGGLIVERGKLSHESLSPLDCRLDLPDEWRFLLATPLREEGLSGAAETETFARLPPVSPSVSERLATELRTSLVPAAAQGDWEGFAASLYRYGHDAGLCYLAVQGGPYHGSRVTKLIDLLRNLRVQGVGQTSWGPTVFAVFPNHEQAEAIAGQLAAQFPEPLELVITPVCNRGARSEWF